MGKIRKLIDLYKYPGFKPKAIIKGKFGDPKARIIKLERRQKKRFAGIVERLIGTYMTERQGLLETCHAGMLEYIWK